MSRLAEGLAAEMRTFVVDRTGLKGEYYFGFQFNGLDTRAPGASLPTLAEAVEQFLGLRLEREMGPVETLVIDRIEKTPKSN